MRYYKTKYSYTQPADDISVGTKRNRFAKKEVTKTESFVVKAASFGDAETQTLEQAGPLPSIDVTHNARVKFWDIVRHDTGDKWYKGKIILISVNDKTGKEKRRAVAILINASSNLEASERLQESMRKSLDPYEIANVDETDIIEVIEPETNGKAGS